MVTFNKTYFSKSGKKPLHLVWPYLGPISLQDRTKIRKARNTLNCCNFQIIFKSERKLSNMFRFKDCVPYDLVSGVVYEYTCGRCNSSYYGETERHLKVSSSEHIGISPLTFKKTKPSKESSIHDHLLECDNNLSFDEFTILAHRNKKYLLEIKESVDKMQSTSLRTKTLVLLCYIYLTRFNLIG